VLSESLCRASCSVFRFAYFTCVLEGASFDRRLNAGAAHAADIKQSFAVSVESENDFV